MDTTTPQEPPTEERTASGRATVAVFVAITVAVVVYFALGMPGMAGMGNGAGDAMSSMPAEAMTIGVDDFATRMAAPNAFVVNVHVPDEGTIEGTDAAIPFDRIVGDARLPSDRSTPILVYCKTGRMSALAAKALMDDGYTDVASLAGGMEAWVAAGRSLR